MSCDVVSAKPATSSPSLGLAEDSAGLSSRILLTWHSYLRCRATDRADFGGARPLPFCRAFAFGTEILDHALCGTLCFGIGVLVCFLQSLSLGELAWLTLDV